jgi:hypothetical protein
MVENIELRKGLIAAKIPKKPSKGYAAPPPPKKPVTDKKG